MAFKVLLHHYGRFTSPPGRKFVDGIVATVDPVELSNFSSNQMKAILTKCLGYDENSATFLYIKKSNRSLDSGLVLLDDAIQDIDSIVSYTQTYQKLLHVYVSRVELSPLVVADQLEDGVCGTVDGGVHVNDDDEWFVVRDTPLGGSEAQQLEQLTNLLDSVSLSNMDDRCFWDLNGEGVFQVKDVRSVLDETFLPKENIPTRWVKSIPIKVNVFVWKLVQDRIPTRLNLMSRNIFVPSVECPVCNNDSESSSHLFFGCQVAKEVLKLICRWWDLVLYDFDNYDGWLLWFKSIRLGSKLKGVLEGVFYVYWWSIWSYRNQLLFASSKPRKSFIFDDIVFRSFNWYVARGKKTLSWVSWIQHPHLLSL
ncbi:RNA-directed DNA polymerase, eukaryota [Tanacetum coccineum]